MNAIKQTAIALYCSKLLSVTLALIALSCFSYAIYLTIKSL